MTGIEHIRWLEPEWPYSQNLRALTTTRVGGASAGPWAGFNLAEHVGDDPGSVAANRATLSRLLGHLPIQWLEQVHGVRVVEAPCQGVPEADAVWTVTPGQVLAVMTADCLPVVLADRAGSMIAVVHGGWRGLVDGILRETLAALPRQPEVAWLGPAIGADVYEVGEEVVSRVRAEGSEFEDALAESPQPGKGYLDLARLAELQLHQLGVSEVFGSGLSTWDTETFYSFRREGETGRMATLAWLPLRRA